MSECIYKGKFTNKQGWLNYSSETVEINIEEIQQYLPDDHPDKIKSNDFKVGDWVVVVESKSRFSDINRAIGYIFQIRGDSSYYEEFMNGFDEAIDGNNKYLVVVFLFVPRMKRLKYPKCILKIYFLDSKA